MPTQDDDLLYPLTHTQVHPLPSHDCIALKLDFLAATESHPGRRYVMSPIQAIELANLLMSAVRTLDDLGPQGTPAGVQRQ